MPRVELTDFGRRCALIDENDEVLADWPINPRWKEKADMPTTKKKPNKSKKPKKKEEENNSPKKPRKRGYY